MPANRPQTHSLIRPRLPCLRAILLSSHSVISSNCGAPALTFNASLPTTPTHAGSKDLQSFFNHGHFLFVIDCNDDGPNCNFVRLVVPLGDPCLHLVEALIATVSMYMLVCYQLCVVIGNILLSSDIGPHQGPATNNSCGSCS